ARARGARRDGVARARGDDDGRRHARDALRTSRRVVGADDGRRADRRGGAARAVLHVASRGADTAVPLARRVKALVYGERWPPTEFEVVDEPSGDVEVVLTLPRFPIGAAQIEALPRLRVIGTASVGYDHIDVKAARARGVAVVSVPDYCTEEVADH